MMWVRMLQPYLTAQQMHVEGGTYEIYDALGKYWCDREIAAMAPTPSGPAEVVSLRLDQGAGRRCLFLPFVGEFGHLVMTHLRIVHFHGASEKVVCCRPGEEVLFPSADRFVTDWTDPVEDIHRIGTARGRMVFWPELRQQFRGHVPVDAGGLSPEEELVELCPGVRLPLRPKVRRLRADVVLGVRRRDFCPERNWPHWRAVAAALNAAGLTFAVVAHRSTSFDLPGQVCHTGDLDTDAAVELLQHCRLYVGTDSGNSHLAASIGADMLLFRETDGGSRDLTGRMAQVNPGRVSVIPDAWSDPEAVIRAVLCRLANSDT